MAARDKRFTIYDMMQAKGVFEANPANSDSPEFAGAIKYPKMLYHPEGKLRQTVPAEIVVTPYGPEKHNEQWEIICQVVANQAEEKKLVDLGWHDHPAKAIHAGGGDAPAISSAERIDDLEGQIARLQAELATANSAKTPAKAKAA